MPIARAISLAGVCDLAGAYREWHGGAVRALMGGSPDRLPERYEVADPLRRVPLSMPVAARARRARRDRLGAPEPDLRSAARAAGGDVELVEIEGEAGDHRAFIDPRGAAMGAGRWRAWNAVRRSHGARPPRCG